MLTGPSFSQILDDSIASAEHRANLERFNAICTVGIVLWCGLIVSDWVLCTYVVPGPLLWYAAIRGLGTPLLGGAIWLTRPGNTLSPRGFRLVEIVAFVGLAWGVSLMTVKGGGLTSPYIAGIIALAIARGAALAERWQDALPANLLIFLGHPTILWIAGWFDPVVGAQWADMQAVAHLGVSLSLVAAMLLLALMGGHSHWVVKREALSAKSVGRYEVLEEIGRGGMGDVWRARVRGTHQEVALKVLRSADREAVLRFEREIASLSALYHPNTVRVIDWGVTENGVPFVAMELLFGRDLDELIKELGPLPIPRAVDVVAQVASALGEAHGKGIVHRDVKPANIKVVDASDGRDHVKILDFGIARSTEVADGVTQHGGAVGTPAYMSPEACYRQAVDSRADVYALGCTLCFTLTGRPPFKGRAADLITAQITKRPPTLAELGLDAPAWLEAVLARCLAKDPRERFADGDELARALAGSMAHPSHPPRTAPVEPVEYSSDTIELETPPGLESRKA